MLTINELKEIKDGCTKKTTVESLLKLLESKYTNKNPAQSVRGTDHIHVINPNRKTPTDNTAKREIKEGFKVQTEGRSRNYDDTQGRPSVG